MKIFSTISDIIDSIEPVVFGLIAAALMVLFPVLIVVREWKKENEVLAIAIVTGILFNVGLAIQELKKGKIG